MKTIVHLIENLGIGGAQTMMFELYHAFARYHSQYNQEVLCLNNRRSDDDFVKSYGVPFTVFRNHKDMKRKISSCKRPVVIFHKLASSRPDIIEKINPRGETSLIVINHTLFHSHQWTRISNRIRVMVAVSDNMREQIRKWYPGIPNYRIYNGVNGYRYDDIKPVPGKKGFVTGRINRICAWKHSDEWVKFCADVNLPVRMTHEYMGGGIASRFGKRGRVKNRNVVKYLGNISDFTQKVSILKNWDLFFYETRRDEGISMAILEALACGIPVICSKNYGNIEIIEEGINGYVFKDYKHARKILSGLAGNKNKIAELKKTTKEHFDKYLDARFAADEYIKLIESISDKKEHVMIQKQNEKDKEKSREEIEEQELILRQQREKQEEIKKGLEDYNRFTVLSAAYNKGPYLLDWAKSILYQTQRPTEVVLVDDCSTDNTHKILPQIENDFSKANIDFKLIRNTKRVFCGSSYKIAMSHAEGFYFGVIDADDMIVPDAVEYIMGLYKKHKDIAWIYTQFQICNVLMKPIKTGFSRVPDPGQSLLNTGERRKHTYSHWRTCSRRHPKLNKIFPKGLRSAVDKFMGYRLEEFAPGAFVDRICYLYRERVSKCISGTEKTKETWMKVVKEAKGRRKRYHLSPFPITIL